ncbi:MAG TPA: HAD family phosphatase [Paracoccaceae bacterium]|nr:HAD family phosphatase [Paracoccaceae bacterium]
MTPRAILFDCDGVLVDSETLTFDLLAGDLARHGLPLSHAEMEARFLGGTIRGLWQTARDLGATLPDDWVDDFYERLYAHLARGTPLIDGVESLLDRLDAAGIPYAVGSNGAPRKMQVTLGQHPRVMARLQGRLFSGQALGCPKPDPGLWLHCAAHLGVDPADCVVVDDSPAGCTAAARAGMRCLGLAEHDDGARLAATGATVIRSLAQVPALIGLQP